MIGEIAADAAIIGLAVTSRRAIPGIHGMHDVRPEVALAE